MENIKKTNYINDCPPHIVASECLSENAKNLLGYFLYYIPRSEAKDTGVIIVSRDMISERTKLNSREINAAKLELKDYGLMDYENGTKRVKGQTSTAGRYYLNFDNIFNEDFRLERTPSYLAVKSLINQGCPVMVNVNRNVNIKGKINGNIKENRKEKIKENRKGNNLFNNIENNIINNLINNKEEQTEESTMNNNINVKEENNNTSTSTLGILPKPQNRRPETIEEIKKRLGLPEDYVPTVEGMDGNGYYHFKGDQIDELTYHSRTSVSTTSNENLPECLM